MYHEYGDYGTYHDMCGSGFPRTLAYSLTADPSTITFFFKRFLNFGGSQPGGVFTEI